VKTLEITGHDAVIQLTAKELVIVNNALNEVCHGIEVPEFSTRMGAEHREASEVLRQINAIVAVMEKTES
jgi:hypothetical protein